MGNQSWPSLADTAGPPALQATPALDRGLPLQPSLPHAPPSAPSHQHTLLVRSGRRQHVETFSPGRPPAVLFASWPQHSPSLPQQQSNSIAGVDTTRTHSHSFSSNLVVRTHSLSTQSAPLLPRQDAPNTPSTQRPPTRRPNPTVLSLCDLIITSIAERRSHIATAQSSLHTSFHSKARLGIFAQHKTQIRWFVLWTNKSTCWKATHTSSTSYTRLPELPTPRYAVCTYLIIRHFKSVTCRILDSI